MTAKELDLCNPGTLHAVARRVGLVAQDRLSQNFLIDREVLEDIANALEATGQDTVLEIGPGIGTLTGELAKRAGSVVAVELDPRCAEATRITQRHRDNVRIVEGDALRTELSLLGLPPVWLAAGNLPYHLTGALLGHLFEAETPPRRGVFLVQREVARRLAAEAGDWSTATVALRSLADVEQVRDVAPQSFDPAPQVFSSVILVKSNPTLSPRDRDAILVLAKGAFQMRRKTLRHGVAHSLGTTTAVAETLLAEAGIDPGRRPGTLELAEWLKLARAAERSVGESRS